MRRLELEQDRQERIENTFQILIIIAALTTFPLTAAYWFEWEHWTITVGDWIVWSVFVAEYAFFMAVSSDRWQTTKNMWLSAAIIVFSFPLLHELLKTTRLIRLVRPVPLLRQSTVLRQIQFFRLSNIRSAGSHVGWSKAKESLGDDSRIVRWMVYLERLKAWIIGKIWPGGEPESDRPSIEKSRAEETE
jgi:hypothetical protein